MGAVSMGEIWSASLRDKFPGPVSHPGLTAPGDLHAGPYDFLSVRA